MPKLFLVNAFSINMLNPNVHHKIDFNPLTLDHATFALSNRDFTSVVGHADMASILTTMLGMKIEYSRETVRLGGSDWMLVVAQYSGPRLPEGTAQLPEGATINFWLVIPH